MLLKVISTVPLMQITRNRIFSGAKMPIRWGVRVLNNNVYARDLFFKIKYCDRVFFLSVLEVVILIKCYNYANQIFQFFLVLLRTPKIP